MQPTVLLIGVAFASVHMVASRLDFLDHAPRRIWLSAAGGVSIAYVFVHLLPELARLDAETAGSDPVMYVAALAGFVVFYGLEAHMRRRSQRKEGSEGAFRLHLGSYALYNVLVGYLLDEQARQEPLSGLLFYAFAMSTHFIVNDRGLAERHGARHGGAARLVLSGAVLLGVVLGAVAELPEATVAWSFALLAGSIVLNVTKEEVPKNGEGRFGAFAIAAAAYTALLLLA